MVKCAYPSLRNTDMRSWFQFLSEEYEHTLTEAFQDYLMLNQFRMSTLQRGMPAARVADSFKQSLEDEWAWTCANIRGVRRAAVSAGISFCELAYNLLERTGINMTQTLDRKLNTEELDATACRALRAVREPGERNGVRRGGGDVWFLHNPPPPSHKALQ